MTHVHAIPGLPDVGWRVRLDKVFSEKCKPFSIPRIKQLPGVIGLGLRYPLFWLKKWRDNKRPFIDQFRMISHEPIYGAPIGGIGCGTIGRGYKGEFCRFQMVPGIYEWKTVEANQFTVCIRRKGQTVYQQVLSPHRPKGKGLNAWNWALNPACAHYHALYPRSWTVYDLPGQDVRLICRQVSPVIPNDYEDSSLPAAVFVWSIENKNAEPIEVSIMFSFKNGQGTKDDKAGGVWNEPFRITDNPIEVSGVMIHQTFRDMDCTYAVSAAQKPGVNVSQKVAFNPRMPCKNVWDDLCNDGRLDSTTDSSSPPTLKGQEVAAAVCAQCTVPAGGTGQLDFSLTWDMPIVHFGAKGRKYKRHYVTLFETNGTAAPQLSPQLASHALNNYPTWEDKIQAWQQPIVQNKDYPEWYRSALFNELYYVSDGGTVWLHPLDEALEANTHSHVKKYGHFAYLEGHEYRMYNTYDVHHYASFALIMLWPKLQLSLQYDIADAIISEDTTRITYLMHGEKGQVKVKNCVPHDLGDPEDEPWVRSNCYNVHPTHDWKDLNTKFVLQCYRDYHATRDLQYLKDMYPIAKIVMTSTECFDVDGDGLIENGNYADQTFDSWPMDGASAYCGGMWLAALYFMCQMCDAAGHPEDLDHYKGLLDKAKVSYEKKLWNGKYYDYDSSQHGYHDSIMADQLAGYWFMKATGVPDNEVIPKDHVDSSLRTIYENNVMGLRQGTMGAVNGCRPNGKTDTSAIQAEEIWSGVTYGLAATMIHEGMLEEGFQTARGIYQTCYETLGFGFQTPEAYMESKHYRALGYMRPLAIWAMQWALDSIKKEDSGAVINKAAQPNDEE